jgi:serine/threonine protein kinase
VHFVLNPERRVSDSAAASDAELRDHVQRTLAATYEVEREIGRGGMGVVYRAIDKRLKRPVAIKLLPPELAFRRDIRQRFQREAETAAQLSHPHIVPIYSVDEIGNLVFFVMACVDGDNLATRLRTRGPLPADDVRRCLIEVADALAYAHGRGVIHRDIKPDNILIDALDGRAMVTDFGIARAAEGGDGARLTATGLAIGTPAYMSPEQASGDRELDGRSDLYSLGVVAYQMLAGEPPFTGNTTPVLLVKHLSEVPVPVEERRPDTPPMLAAMVMRLLEKDPAHRFQSAADFAQVLRSGIVPPASLPPRSRPADPAVRSPVSGAGAELPSGSSGASAGAAPLTRASAGSAPPSWSPSAAAPVSPHSYAPSAEELVRWESRSVSAFRRKLAPFLFVNTVLLFLSLFSNTNFLPITTIWSIVLAYQYAKLWSDGYDWRDVLRQPKERMFGDVLSDVGESIESAFSRKKREQLRAEGRTGAGLFGVRSSRAPVPAVTTGDARFTTASFGAHGAIVEGARAARDEIARLLATLPVPDRMKIPDVAPTAISLVQKVEQLTATLAATDDALARRPLVAVDEEIERLEAAANPLDPGSEARVRRLASLRRERRATLDLARRRADALSRLDACTLALENMRLDLVRLRTGGASVHSVTQVAEEAMALARDVDRVISAAEEVRALTAARGVSA